jgi:hypothetical protein
VVSNNAVAYTFNTGGGSLGWRFGYKQAQMSYLNGAHLQRHGTSNRLREQQRFARLTAGATIVENSASIDLIANVNLGPIVVSATVWTAGPSGEQAMARKRRVRRVWRRHDVRQR